MRFYGDIESNLSKLCEEYEIEDIGYSVDSLMFETEDGESFNIDFEEGDYAIYDLGITFRLKSMGSTFSEEWENLKGLNMAVLFENDSRFFNTVKLKSISVYIPEHPKVTEEFLGKLKYKVKEGYIQIGNKSIYYNPNNVVVE